MGTHPWLSVQVGRKECRVELTQSLQNSLDLPHDCLASPPASPPPMECRSLEAWVRQQMQPKTSQTTRGVRASVDATTRTVNFGNGRTLLVPDDLLPKSPARCRGFNVSIGET